MKAIVRNAATALLVLAAGMALAQAPKSSGNEGLVAVKAKQVDQAWLLPGADFRPYRKVLLKRAEVAFQKNWARDMSESTGSRVGPRVTDADAMKIIEVARTGLLATYRSVIWLLASGPRCGSDPEWRASASERRMACA